MNHFIVEGKEESFFLSIMVHSLSINALELAYEHTAILLSLSLVECTMHTLQQLDVSFCKALKCCYIEEMVKWLRANPGHCVTPSITVPFRKA
jgi:hypothetical protein